MSLVKVGPCLHCKRTLGWQGRGLCKKCHTTPGVKELYPAMRHAKLGSPRDDSATDAELDALIAEQYANRPAWWDAEEERKVEDCEGRRRESRPVRVLVVKYGKFHLR